MSSGGQAPFVDLSNLQQVSSAVLLHTLPALCHHRISAEGNSN